MTQLCVKSWVYIFSGSFGSFDSEVDDKRANEPNEPARLVDEIKVALYSVI